MVVRAIRLEGQKICLDDIADVHKVARLVAVFKDQRPLIVEQARGKNGADARVRVRKSLPRPVDIEKAQRHRGYSVSVAEHQAELFLVLFGDRIDGSRK